MTEFVKFFFTLQNTLKLYHWSTKSYSRHISSDNLFNNIILTSDKFMETFQGKYGKINVGVEFITNNKVLNDNEIIVFLNEAKIWLQSVVKNNMLNIEDTDLLNIRDDLLGNINQTLYLFTFN
jgi:hypothetical protein